MIYCQVKDCKYNKNGMFCAEENLIISNKGKCQKYIDYKKDSKKSEKGYCEYCKIFHQCPWFCNNKNKIDDENNPIEPCFSREYFNEGNTQAFDK